MTMNNPFDITKAVDYTNEEILKYWVDLDGDGLMSIMKPHSAMPMLIKGSKGSGKTHIMKFYSYELQKIRSRDKDIQLRDFLDENQFIGVYIRCSGFNAEQFCGKGVSDDLWKVLYAYFWELWVGERLITLLMDLLQNGVLTNFDEAEFVQRVLRLFLARVECEHTLDRLRILFLNLQKHIMYEIQNFIFTNKEIPQVQILLAANNLTYGIPNILSEDVPFFENKRIIYLIDELENFSELQQELVQSLIREKPISCTFRVGSRPYGIRTYRTLSGEINHEGEEFDLVSLDEELRNNDRYSEYVTKICEKRLRNSSINIPENFSIKRMIQNQDVNDILKLVYEKKESQARSYLKKLENNLKMNMVYLKLSEQNVREIINILSFPDDPIIERTNVYLFYRKCKNPHKRILEDANAIRESAILFHNENDITTEHAIFLDKYKQDVINTIAREGRVAIPYNGLERLILLSCGTPRTILRILKTAFNKQYFNTGKIPFEKERLLSIYSQRDAIEDTAEWFFEENRIPSSNGRPADAIARLGSYLQSIRFSDLPPQCSISIFALNVRELTDSARETFEKLVKYSYIIELHERREKNSNNKVTVFQLNNILIPKWELSLGKRGLIQLTSKEANLIFDESQKQLFEEYKREKLRKYNFPFDQVKFKQEIPTLFDPIKV